MKINIKGKETNTGTLSKVKFNTETKEFMTGKYNVCGGDLLIQASSNREVEALIIDLQNQGFVKVNEL